MTSLVPVPVQCTALEPRTWVSTQTTHTRHISRLSYDLSRLIRDGCGQSALGSGAVVTYDCRVTWQAHLLALNSQQNNTLQKEVVLAAREIPL